MHRLSKSSVSSLLSLYGGTAAARSASCCPVVTVDRAEHRAGPLGRFYSAGIGGGRELPCSSSRRFLAGFGLRCESTAAASDSGSPASEKYEYQAEAIMFRFCLGWDVE
ncbi:hypothetical protein MLD38_029246 [Melastoma candidum]|uniref:Uncharacterized protein n=1 Tax=Melastoma candidum TaxID=119954 RepID=A0ACB9N372_9MYRT|nr:hypothetical protein MLD38_029246 [Melastoma candidum]